MDTKETGKLFKTAFKGFDKKDVNDYIKKLSEKFDETIAAKAKEIVNYKAKILELVTEQKDLAEENERLKKEFEQVENNRVESDSEAIKNMEAEIDRLTGENERLEAELSKMSVQSDKQKMEIADVLIKAEQMAKRLCDEAVISANEEKAAIERQIVSKKSELLGLTGEIERMKGVFSDLYKKYVSDK